MEIEGKEIHGLQELQQGFLWIPANPLQQEIAERLIHTPYQYDLFDHFEKEVRLREAIVEGMGLLDQGDLVGYNHDGEALRLPEASWKSVVAYDSNGSPALTARDHVTWSNPGAAFESIGDKMGALNALFAPRGNSQESYYLECNTATVAMHYRALGQILTPKGFNFLFPSGIILLPEWLTFGAGKNRQAPSLELIPDSKQVVERLSDLIPGDWVYFANFPDYEKKHEIGAFTGENALYLGGGRYQGFGVAAMSYEVMNKYLIDQYNDDLRKKEKKKAREKSGETLDGLVPGILKNQVRRMMENAKVLKALDMG